jgi:hypothetical protein
LTKNQVREIVIPDRRHHANDENKKPKQKMKTKSLMTGWTKIAKSHYRHETKVEVLKDNQGWHVIGGSNCGYAYSTMWVAMYEAAKTKAEFVRSI